MTAITFGMVSNTSASWVTASDAIAAVSPHRPQDNFTRELLTRESAHRPNYSTLALAIFRVCNREDEGTP